MDARGSDLSLLPRGPYYMVTFIFNDYFRFSVFSQLIFICSHINSYVDGQTTPFMLR